MQTNFSKARTQLSLRFGLFSASLLLVFGTVVYLEVKQSRESLLQLQLQQLAAAAAAQLPLLSHELEEKEQSGNGHKIEPTETGQLDTQGINLGRKQIRWFNPQLRELSRYGRFQINGSVLPPTQQRNSSSYLGHSNGLSIWKPVYLREEHDINPVLVGYVSVTLSSQATEDELHRLLRGLIIGAGLASLVAGGGSLWLVSSALQPIKQQIERLEQFTADASHELRHPLTAIRAVIDSLRQGSGWQNTDPLLQNKFNLINQTVEQMTRLVEDLLLLARLDRSYGDPSGWQRFALEDLLEDILDLYQDSAQQHGLKLKAALETTALIRAHPVRLKQLLVNLLVNAIRFSPRGGTVTLGLRSSNRWLEVWVEDEGPGIPLEQREQVFERFWQADSARSDRSNTGLGLAMARAIAESHGGQLLAQASSSASGGCRMLLRLPLQR